MRLSEVPSYNSNRDVGGLMTHGTLTRMGFSLPDFSSGNPERGVALSFRPWAPEDAGAIHGLERFAWAPGIRRPLTHIQRIARDYPQTQFLGTTPGGLLVATTTAMRMQLDGENPLQETPWARIKWDHVAGGSVDEGNYEQYNLTGNTLCLMSAAVHPDYRGQDYGKEILIHAIKEAKNLGMKYVVAPFRPSRFGVERKTSENPVSFAEYAQRKDANGKLTDPWLRVAESLGMEFLDVVEPSMTVTVNKDTLRRYTHDPYFQQPRFQSYSNWDGGEVWDYGDTGFWKRNEDGATYTYTEGNVWMGASIDKLTRALAASSS